MKQLDTFPEKLVNSIAISTTMVSDKHWMFDNQVISIEIIFFFRFYNGLNLLGNVSCFHNSECSEAEKSSHGEITFDQFFCFCVLSQKNVVDNLKNGQKLSLLFGKHFFFFSKLDFWSGTCLSVIWCQKCCKHPPIFRTKLNTTFVATKMTRFHFGIPPNFSHFCKLVFFTNLLLKIPPPLLSKKRYMPNKSFFLWGSSFQRGRGNHVFQKFWIDQL